MSCKASHIAWVSKVNPGGLHAGQAMPCHSGAMRESPFPKTKTLVPGCTWALGPARLATISAWTQEDAPRGQTPGYHRERLWSGAKSPRCGWPCCGGGERRA